MDDQTKDRADFDPREAFYTGPGTLAGRYLRSFWQPIFPSKNVKPGRARPIRVLGENFTLYRGEQGAPHLVDHRCAHRGTQLSAGQVEGDNIRCFYHGWMYDKNGQCIEQPGEERPFCKNVRIRTYPARDYLGLVFVYLGEGEPPPFPRYERFEPWADSLTLMVEVAPYNYFQRIENSHDFVHLPFVHKHAYPAAAKRTLDTVIPRIATEECAWGMITHRIDPTGLDLVAYFGMPNINYIMGNPGREWEGEGELLFMRVPLDDNSHIQFRLGWSNPPRVDKVSETPERDEVELVNAKRNQLARAVLEGDMTIDEVIAMPWKPGTPDLFSIQDDVATLGQGTVWERRPEHLGGSDRAIALLRKLWTRDLRALRDGKPRQSWHRTPDMVPSVAAMPHELR